jgi:hypothetical protein
VTLATGLVVLKYVLAAGAIAVAVTTAILLLVVYRGPR